MDRFSECYEIVRKEEGGYVNHPNDKGGATNYGVTQEVYDRFNMENNLPTKSVTDITENEVKQIYFSYWAKADCSRFPEPIDLLIFDVAINSGPIKAIVILQRALGMEEKLQTGYFGSITEGKLVRADLTKLAKAYLRERVKFYCNRCILDPTQRIFLDGWLNRVDNIREYIHARQD